MDCMLHMKDIPDKFYDLAIVDPPYGIGVAKNGYSTLVEGGKGLAKRKNYGAKNWDISMPNKAYFDDLFRIMSESNNLGGNYFIDYLRSTSCFIVWDKDNGTFSMADCELAWCSFNTAVRKYKFIWNRMLQQNMSNKEDPYSSHSKARPTLQVAFKELRKA